MQGRITLLTLQAQYWTLWAGKRIRRQCKEKRKRAAADAVGVASFVAIDNAHFGLDGALDTSL
jgi:hypothetical protein